MFDLRRVMFYMLITTVAAAALLHPRLLPEAYPPDQIATASVRIKAVFSLLAILSLVIPRAVVQMLFTRAMLHIDRRHRTIHRMLKIQRLEMVSADQVRRGLLMLGRGTQRVIVLMLWGLFLSRILNLFPDAQPIADDLQLMVITPLEAIGQAVLDYLPNLVQIVIILLVTRYVLKGIHLFFHAVEAEIIVLPDFYPEWAEPTYKITRMLIIIFIPFAILPLLPMADSRFFEEISFFVGLLVSFGSTSAIKNMTAGIVLTYTRSFQIGDRVCIADVTGDVVEKSLFVTRLRTVKNELVAMPNGTVLDSNIMNYTALAKANGLILHTTITIGYDVDWRQVQDLLIDAALVTPHVLENPRPFVLQTSLDDYYVAYEINVHTDHAHLIPETLSVLRRNILDAFHTAGVEIMSPGYTALRNGNDAAVPLQRPPQQLDVPYTAPLAYAFAPHHQDQEAR